MEGKGFTIAEAKKHLSAPVKSSKHEVIGAAKDMPASGGFILRFHNGRRIN